MKKIIEIDDSIVKQLKLLAVNNDKSFKGYLESLIKSHHENTLKLELAKRASNDGQSFRFILYMLLDIYEAIKGVEFNYGEGKIESITDFLDLVEEACSYRKDEMLYNDIED